MSRRAGLAVVVVTVAAAGCTSPAAEDGGVAAPMVAAPTPGDEVVATVDGRPITAAAVALQARARGVDARTALADLVDAEVLAGAAHARGLDRTLGPTLAARGAMVRRFLQASFEVEVTPADVPMAMVKKAYLRNQPYLNHDEYVDVWHILVLAQQKSSTEAQRAAARALAAELAKQAKGKTFPEFNALADQLRASGHQEVDEAKEVVTERDGWTQKSFSYAAFEQLRKAGDVGTAETTFGAHALYLVRYLPPQHTPIEKAEADLRKGLFISDVQKRAFAHFVDEAMTRHRVELHAERLPKDDE